MKVIKDITENDMIAAFLKAEISSPRFKHLIIQQLDKNPDFSFIKNPNLESSEENILRKKILGKYRGYGRDESLFSKFPTDIEWKKVALSLDELKMVQYMKYSFWEEISGGTRFPKDAVSIIKNGKEIFGQSLESFIDFANVLDKNKSLPELILVTTNLTDQLVVLEGHARITAYMLRPEVLSKNIEVIVGISDRMTEWGSYGYQTHKKSR